MHLDHIVERIDQAFGDELPFSGQPLDPLDQEALNRVFGDAGFQDYLQDQVNRQIIRDYLTNAIVLGYLTEEALAPFTGQMGRVEGRSALSLQMLMSSVEQAGDLAAAVGHDRLVSLDQDKPAPQHIRLVHSKP